MLDFQAIFTMKKWDEKKKEHMNSSLFCRLLESLWDQRGLGPFHTLDTIQKMVSANASSTTFSSKGLPVQIKPVSGFRAQSPIYLYPEDTI